MSPSLKFVTACAFFSLAVGAASTAFAAGDAAAGKKMFVRCAGCHSLKEGKNKFGPSLYGVVGRHSASLKSYHYSKAMEAADETWNEATLDKYLENPRKMIPGTKMMFPGLPKEQDRLNMIAYLEQAGGKAQ